MDISEDSWPWRSVSGQQRPQNAWLETMLDYVYMTKPSQTNLQERSSIRLDMLDDFIDSQLENIKGQASQSEFGRLGPDHMMFDVCTNVGSLIIDKDRLGVSSQSNFNTIRANGCVYKGKWQYELMLGSKGVMQVGWATINCKFSQEKGVGDTPDSYAYDGNRVRKWNVATFKYGEPWLTGDVIGSCLDLDKGTLHFYRNGTDLGEAFNNIRVGPGIAYFPAVSLAYNENLVANFGATPLRYPVEGYNPLEKVPLRDVERARLLLMWLKRVLPVYEEVDRGRVQSSYLTDGLELIRQGTKAQALLIAAPILRRLGPLLGCGYVTEVCLLPLLFQLSEESEDVSNNRITVLLDVLWALLEPYEIYQCLEHIAIALLSGFRYSHSTADFSQQKKYLSLALSLFKHHASRRYLLRNILFDKMKFPVFMEVKPLDNMALTTVIPNVWFELAEELHPPEETYKKASYHASREKLKAIVSEVEELQLEILVHLTTDEDLQQGHTSRDIFLAKFQEFLKENSAGSRTPPAHLCPQSVALCFFHRLVGFLRKCLPVWNPSTGKLMQEYSLHVPTYLFLSDTWNHTDNPRVGGLVSHLKTTLQEEVTKTLESVAAQASYNEHLVLDSVLTPHMKKPEATLKVFKLLDGVIRLYNISVNAQLEKLCSMRETMKEYLTALQDVRKNCKEREDDVVNTLHQTEDVFQQKLAEQSRHLAWLSSIVYSKEKQGDLYWLLQVILQTLEEASRMGPLFAFVPDFYVESCIKIFTALRTFFPPTSVLSDIPGHYNVLVRYSTFLAQHFADPRVVNADLKDTLVQALATHVCPPVTLRALECMPIESSMTMIQALLQPYENRAWAQSNWILVRLWKGCGFAFRYTIPPHLVKRISSRPVESVLPNQPAPCPSVFFQMHIGRWLEDNPEPAAAFLGSVLTQLNWAFSEFISMLQEIQNACNRPERVFIDSRQLKICATCFDLALALLRVLEMVINVAPAFMTSPSRPLSEVFLARICQLISQVLNRVTSRCGCFDLVVNMEIAGLETIDHFPILAAVTGILTALLLKGPLESRENSLTALLSEPSFQPSSLEFLLGGSAGTSSKPDTDQTQPFSLANYTEVKEEEIEQVRQLIQLVQSKNMQSTPHLDEDELCTICYAFRKSARFHPCGHQSCRFCISLHLVHHRECFFCKAIIEKVDADPPIPVHNQK